MARYYEPFERIRRDGLDALIITGANVTGPDLSGEPFWEPLIEVMAWAWDNVSSTLCSCLATHAVLQFRYGKRRQPLGAKRWGVFPHRVVDRTHPLVNTVNTLFDVPHSRFNDISRGQLEEAGLHILAESERAGVHLAVSADGFRQVFFQGHPEYDTISLLKEYKREVGRFAAGERSDYPPFPECYFCLQSRAILDEHALAVRTARESGAPAPPVPGGAHRRPSGQYLARHRRRGGGELDGPDLPGDPQRPQAALYGPYRSVRSARAWAGSCGAELSLSLSLSQVAGRLKSGLNT